MEGTWPVVSLSVCCLQPSPRKEAESHGKAATCPRYTARQGGKPEWSEDFTPNQASPPSLGLPGPGLGSTLGQTVLFCSDDTSMPSLRLHYLLGLSLAMAPEPALTHHLPLPQSARSLLLQLGSCLPTFPVLPGQIHCLPSPSGKQGVG